MPLLLTSLRRQVFPVKAHNENISYIVVNFVSLSGLVRFGNIDGLFLVRESSYSSSSFVLSLVSRGTFYHFQINEIKKCHFSIDDGPIVHGNT